MDQCLPLKSLPDFVKLFHLKLEVLVFDLYFEQWPTHQLFRQKFTYWLCFTLFCYCHCDCQFHYLCFSYYCSEQSDHLNWLSWSFLLNPSFGQDHQSGHHRFELQMPLSLVLLLHLSLLPRLHNILLHIHIRILENYKWSVIDLAFPPTFGLTS